MNRHTETRRLGLALAISCVYFFAEVIGGFLTNSLALLSDAGHMLSDIAALALSLFAFRIARRPTTESLEAPEIERIDSIIYTDPSAKYRQAAISSAR